MITADNFGLDQTLVGPAQTPPPVPARLKCSAQTTSAIIITFYCITNRPSGGLGLCPKNPQGAAPLDLQIWAPPRPALAGRQKAAWLLSEERVWDGFSVKGALYPSRLRREHKIASRFAGKPLTLSAFPWLCCRFLRSSGRVFAIEHGLYSSNNGKGDWSLSPRL